MRAVDTFATRLTARTVRGSALPYSLATSAASAPGAIRGMASSGQSRTMWS